MLPTSRQPDDISPEWAKRLTRIFGDESWRNLYQEDPQGNLFGGVEYQRVPGVDGLIDLYKEKLRNPFWQKISGEISNSKELQEFPIVRVYVLRGKPEWNRSR